jgi:LmbE family N-acetylglucosaminyl deacetylase
MQSRKIMAVAAHADDIEIGAGGTLAKYHEQGYEIVYVMATNNMSGGVQERQPDGSIKRWKESSVPMMARRKRECDAAAAEYGTTPIHLDHPQRHYWHEDGSRGNLTYGCPLPAGVPEDAPTIFTAHEDPASRKRLVDLMLEHDPQCVFTHGLATYTLEHVGTAFLVTQSYWEAVEAGFKGALLHWREDYTRFGPANERWDTHVDISDHLDRKLEVLGKHACQMPTTDDPQHGHRLRPLKWGVVCGCKAAEVFTWVSRDRRIDNDCTYVGFSPLLAELTQNSR